MIVQHSTKTIFQVWQMIVESSFTSRQRSLRLWPNSSSSTDELQSVNSQKVAIHLSIYRQISPTQKLHQLHKCLLRNIEIHVILIWDIYFKRCQLIDSKDILYLQNSKNKANLRAYKLKNKLASIWKLILVAKIEQSSVIVQFIQIKSTLCSSHKQCYFCWNASSIFIFSFKLLNVYFSNLLRCDTPYRGHPTNFFYKLADRDTWIW